MVAGWLWWCLRSKGFEDLVVNQDRAALPAIRTNRDGGDTTANPGDVGDREGGGQPPSHDTDGSSGT